MPIDYRLWSLNAVTPHFENGTHWDYPVTSSQSVRFTAAKRDSGVNRPNEELGTPTKRTQLMHEGTKVDEYWVPIPIKCFGTHFRSKWLDTTDATKVALFDAIEAEYSTQFQNASTYWVGLAHDPRTRMGTRSGVDANGNFEGLGLYDVLQHYSTDPSVRHILVGYSQGGVVGRYLAFIDEHLSKRRIVSGAITVHSPNQGSIFASAKNADRIVAGLLGILLAGGGVDLDVLRTFHMELQASMPAGKGLVILEWLAAATRKGLAHYEARYSQVLQMVKSNLPANPASTFEERLWNDDLLRGLRAKSAVLFTIHQWLSGVRGDPAYAFHALDVRDLDRPATVLGTLHANPLTKVIHGALVGWDVDPARLVMPGLFSFADNFVPAVGERAEDIREIARDQIMHEVAIAPNTIAQQYHNYLQSFVHGTDAVDLHVFDGTALRAGNRSAYFNPGTIDQRAHDFIVPAAYQVILPPTNTMHSDRFLGNFVFRDESHAVGVNACRPALMNLLGLLAQRLP